MNGRPFLSATRRRKKKEGKWKVLLYEPPLIDQIIVLLPDFTGERKTGFLMPLSSSVWQEGGKGKKIKAASRGSLHHNKMAHREKRKRREEGELLAMGATPADVRKKKKKLHPK